MTGYEKRIGDRKIAIGLGILPDRKRPCLLVREDNVTTKCASFNDLETAYMFFELFADFIGAERIEWFGREVTHEQRNNF